MTQTMDPSTPPIKCSHCEKPMRSPVFCQNCRVINPVEPGTDFFVLFGLPRRYEIDPQELHRRFLNLTRDIHPDRFATSAPETVNVTMRLAAQINEAYKVLKDPVLRAEYLLQRAGGRRSAEDKRVPGELLTEVMELRERIEEARTHDDRAALDAYRRQVEDMRAAVQHRVSELAEAVADRPDDERLVALRAQLNAIRYVQNLQDLLAGRT